jgi:hypothetical protein
MKVNYKIKGGLVDIVGAAGQKIYKEKTNKNWMFMPMKFLFKP